MRMPAQMRRRRELTQPNTGGAIARALVALAMLALAGCTITRDIKLRAPDGTEVKCEGVTGIYGLRSHTLLNVQRDCVKDYQQAGYVRVPDEQPTQR